MLDFAPQQAAPPADPAMDPMAPPEPPPFGVADLEAIVPALRMRQCIDGSEHYLESFRAVAQEHAAYFAGRWYGGLRLTQDRPLNLIAQQVRAFCPKLIPQRLDHTPNPKKPGLELEGMTLKRLLEQDDQEQEICENVYDPMITEAFFAPLSVSYTGLRPGARVLETIESDIDPGEPFITHIEFNDWLIDHFAKNLRSRLWEGHKFRVPRQWLLESPAYQDAATQELIKGLPSWESQQAGKVSTSSSTGKSFGSEESAVFETIELVNVCIYHHSGIYEGTIASVDFGAPRWLRACRWEGPDGGPYDHLVFQKCPGMLIPIAILSLSRDLAESGDQLARKVIESALASKKILGYEEGAEDEADAMAQSPNSGTVKMSDVKAAQVFDINMISGDLMKMVPFVTQLWNDSTGQARLASGADTGDKTLGQADIRNAQAGDNVAYMLGKIKKLASSHSRKRAYLFMTKPGADYTVPMRVPSMTGGVDQEVIELAFNAMTRQGRPQDYEFDCDAVPVAQGSPEMRARRVLESIDTLGKNLLMFQSGILSLPKTMRFLERNVADGLSECAGDPMMAQEQMMARMAQEAFYDQAAGVGGPPGGGGAGGSGAPPAAPGGSPDQPTTMNGARQQAYGGGQ